MRALILLLLILLLGACNTDPVVLVATPVPPDSGFHTYTHPTGVFSIRLPPTWSIRDVSQGNIIRVEFSPPGNPGLPMTVYVLNTGNIITTSGLLDTIDRYQAIINGDSSVYQEISRNAQGDGSWRLIGVRQTPIGPRQLNTFLQADGTFLTATEVDLTSLDAPTTEQMRIAINTLRVDANAVMAPSDIEAADRNASTTSGVLTFSGLYSWTNPGGEFIINGQVTNQSGNALEAIRITAFLFDAQGNVLAEQSNVVPVDVLQDRGIAPFSVRFRGGKPGRTTRYELHAAARAAEYALQSHMSADKFILGNDVASYNADGYLTVRGDVVNQTQGAAYFVKVVIALFDEAGQVVATDNVFLNKPNLLPGEVSRFELTFPELGGNAIRYSILVEGKSRSAE